jgi:hypothetical protein
LKEQKQQGKELPTVVFCWVVMLTMEKKEKKEKRRRRKKERRGRGKKSEKNQGACGGSYKLESCSTIANKFKSPKLNAFFP